MSLNNLTRSEMKMLRSLAQGKLYKEIAHENNLSINTVKKHLKNTYRKLNVRNRMEAANSLMKNQHAMAS